MSGFAIVSISHWHAGMCGEFAIRRGRRPLEGTFTFVENVFIKLALPLLGVAFLFIFILVRVVGKGLTY